VLVVRASHRSARYRRLFLLQPEQVVVSGTNYSYPTYLQAPRLHQNRLEGIVR
jgi:hypothetical protein